MAISAVVPSWMSHIVDTYSTEEKSSSILAALAVNSASISHFTLKDGVLRYKTRIWVGNDSAVHNRIIVALHSSVVGGHFGIRVIVRRVKQVLVWTGLKTSVSNFVTSCQIC